jgi:hypothetical protein
MAYTLEIKSAAPPLRVLEAIRSLNQEGRDSSLPPELQARGAQWIRARTRKDRFTLSYGSNWEAKPAVVIAGMVREAANGSSAITAKVGYGRFRQAGAALFCILGVWGIQSGGAWGYLLLGIAGPMALWCEWQHFAVAPAADEEAAFLAEKLERSIADAGAAG